MQSKQAIVLETALLRELRGERGVWDSRPSMYLMSSLSGSYMSGVTVNAFQKPKRFVSLTVPLCSVADMRGEIGIQWQYLNQRNQQLRYYCNSG
jgi:hypothetical protein